MTAGRYERDNPHITAVGRELDALLADLITLLGGDVPQQLTAVNASRTQRI